MKAQRVAGGWICVDGDDKDKRWSFEDPRAALSCVTTLDYLLYVCPTSREAAEKLAAMRRAVRIVDASALREGQEGKVPESGSAPAAPPILGPGEAPKCVTCGGPTEVAGHNKDGTVDYCCVGCGDAPCDCRCHIPAAAGPREKGPT